MSAKLKVPREFFFVISSAPALTGFFLSLFDIALILFFIKDLFLGRIRPTQSSLLFFSLFVSLVTASFIFTDGVVDVVDYIQWLFFICIMFFLYWMFSSGCLSESRGLYFWALGIVPNFMVAIIQQIYPGLDIFNLAEYKSNPIPGYDFIRASGLLYNPNSLAAYGIMCFVYFLFKDRYILSVIGFFSVLVTFSKTFFAIPFIGLLRFIFGKKSSGFLVYSIFFLMVMIIGGEGVLWMFSNRLEYANSFGSRTAVINMMFGEVATIKQVLLGVGPQMDIIDEVGRVHNKFFSVFFQFGLLGLMPLLIMAIYFFLCLFKSCVCFYDKCFFVVFVLVWLGIASVSTFTFFTYEYVVIVILFSAVVNKGPIVLPRRGGSDHQGSGVHQG